jgi:molybdopterin-binding protein
MLLCMSQNHTGYITQMQISARNALKATVKKVVEGSVNNEVILEVAPGVEITAIITKSSADKLQLTEGKEAYAVIKASDVMVAVD